MSIRDHRRGADFHREGEDFQRSLATVYNRLYLLWQGTLIRHTNLRVISATAFQRLDQPQAVSILIFDMDDTVESFPALLEALVVEHMIEDPWSRIFLTPQPHLDQTSLQAAGQTLFARPLHSQQPRNLILVEVLMMGSIPDQWKIDTIEQMIVYSMSPVNRDMLLHLTDLGVECIDRQCLLTLNGRHATETGEQHWVPDGSILTVKVWQDEQIEDPITNDEVNRMEDEDSESSMNEPNQHA